ncbi:MAG TPA: alpha-glucan family phosphorylase [Rhodocyclaceae bacterium]|nr:alpha-glucan family phosphorylase [Rhodocyclaceae bacterium]
MSGTPYFMEVRPRVPEKLGRLDELAHNLWYTWDRSTRTMFARLHPALWHAAGHSPKAFLKRVHQRRLDAAADDPVFLAGFHRVLSAYDTYHQDTRRDPLVERLGENGLIAYFCAEFGLHESLPIYSGGLGILAGDHLKAASDMRLPFVAVGLLYSQGYFAQTIDREGRQHALYTDSDFDDLPISPVIGNDGRLVRIAVDYPGRQVWARIWRARIGHVFLYLLDTDVEDNSPADRDICHRLYGGDRTTRIEQEIMLGIGGVRALAAVGLSPTAWHVNEGHAAFLALERVRVLMQAGLDFPSALEAIAASTVFTTHTAVPAGHDHFGEDMMRHYFDAWCRETGMPFEALMALGNGHGDGSREFNMTALAIRSSRYHNGVSAIHGGVSSRICAYLWPEIEAHENPMTHITNGVHVPTFVAQDWHELFDKYLGHGWMQRATDPQCWARVHSIPDQQFWSVRQALKVQMLHLIRARVSEQCARNEVSGAHLDRLLKLADPDHPNVLTIGFARRFATYKRATLLFSDLDRLLRLVTNPACPVLFIFAGKAHPADEPGQAFIRRINEVANMPEFEGHILLIEGYDLRLARRLVSGCDVWLNNPIYPLEASGTSGIKAAMNGVPNLSVLDGWWGEGYDGTNGWAIKPASRMSNPMERDAEEARTLYELLQDQVTKAYYDVGPMGYSPKWIALAKSAIATLLPRFNAHRMLTEYMEKFYVPASRAHTVFSGDGHAHARSLAAWKSKVRAAWPGVGLRRIDTPQPRVEYGESLHVEIALKLNGLEPSDVRVELIFGWSRGGTETPIQGRHYHFIPGHQLLSGEQVYELDLHPDLCGKIEYHIRAYPAHPLLTHPFELGLMRWL